MQHRKAAATILLFVYLIVCIPLAVPSASAQVDSVDIDDSEFDASGARSAAFIIAKGAVYVGGVGWYAGYIVQAQSGTYTLNISITGSKHQFPIRDIKVIVAVSDAAVDGGLSSLSVNGLAINSFIPGEPSYYGAQGGPFCEPDYYGYNDQYVIDKLTYNQAHYPENWYQITATVEFASGATPESKVTFLLYGTDNQGRAVKTPFSGGTLFVVPEYPLPVLGIVSFFCSLVVFKKRGMLHRKAKL